MYLPVNGTPHVREDLSNRAAALEANRDSIAHLLSMFPDEGGELSLDAFSLAMFRLDPPAFLTKSVKQK